jgi:hypothetical protein
MPSNQPAAIDTCMNRPMNNVQQAIRDAAEKGGYRYRWWKVNDLEHNEGYNGLQLRALTEHLHDPDFWKALATARKWEDANAWRFHWHRFIDHLADGKDCESLFRRLMKSKCFLSWIQRRHRVRRRACGHARDAAHRSNGQIPI